MIMRIIDSIIMTLHSHISQQREEKRDVLLISSDTLFISAYQFILK